MNYLEPSRLVAARKVKQMTVAELAEKAQLSPSAIRAIEGGSRDGTPHLSSFSRALERPESFFVGKPVSLIAKENLSYRKRKSMRLTDQEALRCWVSLVTSDFLPVFKERIDLPKPSFPEWESRSGEEAARSLRQMFDMGSSPLRHAIDLAETMGAFVFWYDGPEDFDGVSFWAGAQPCIVLNINKRDGYRLRFTVLHEVGHLILHRWDDALNAKADAEADDFASAMLLPSSTFYRWCPRRFDRFILLEGRRTWGASVSAMVRRARDLGIFNEYQYHDAFIQISKAGWRSGEPSPARPEHSTLHHQMFLQAGDRGEGPTEIAARGRMPLADLIKAAPLAEEFSFESRISDLFI